MRRALVLATALLTAACGDDATAPEPVSRAQVLRGTTLLLDVEVELAVTGQERTLGLRGRTTLLPSEGLVLLFPVESEVCLVNDGVPFPIDAVYADDDGTVVTVESLEADDPTPLCHPQTRTVLEVVATVADSVAAGDRLIVDP